MSEHCGPVRLYWPQAATTSQVGYPRPPKDLPPSPPVAGRVCKAGQGNGNEADKASRAAEAEGKAAASSTRTTTFAATTTDLAPGKQAQSPAPASPAIKNTSQVSLWLC